MDARGEFAFTGGTGATTMNDLLVGATALVPENTPAGSYRGVAQARLIVGKKIYTCTFTINMVLLAANSVETERNMTFPAQMQVFHGIYILSPGDVGSAIFSSSGQAGASAQAQIIPSTVTLSLRNELRHTNQGIEVYGFEFSGNDGTMSPNGSFRFPGRSNQPVEQVIKVGATANYPANLTGGTYQGSATLQITYK